MARTSKSRGVEPFSMRSGKGSTFKMMGSSPMLVGEKEKVTMGEEKIVGTSTTESEKSTDIKTDYRTKGKGYTPPTTTPEGDKAYAALTQVEKDAQDAKYKKGNTRDIVVDRSETKSTSKEYVPNPDLTAKRYTIEMRGKAGGSYKKGDDGVSEINLRDNAGRLVFSGSQEEYNSEYGEHLTRGGSSTQVGNKKQFLYSRSEQEKSKEKYGDFFKSSATPKKNKK
mgnify:CR=1 FL=1